MRWRNAVRGIVVVFALMLPFAFVGLAAAPAAAGPNDFTFDSMTSDFYLDRDAGGNATLRVVETLVAVFPDFDQNHGIERAIPLDADGVPFETSIISVTDAEGAPYPYSYTEDGGFAILRIGSGSSYMQGTKTFVIEYTQRNVALSAKDLGVDEFYRDVNGTGWNQPFGTVSATLHLTDDLTALLTGKSACYQGAEGSAARCDITRSGNTFTAQASNLGPGQNMTIAVGFDDKTFVEPPNPKNNWVFAILPWVLLGLTIAALLFSIVVRNFVWRDAPGRGIIVPQYTPPKNAYPMLAAELLGRKKSGLPAQIVRFAVAKVLAIREHPDKPKNKQYELELLAGWPTAPSDEEWVLKALFGDVALGKTVFLDSSNRKIGDRLAAQANKVVREVDNNGWRAKPKSKLPRILRWSTFGIAMAALAIRFATIWFDVDPPGVGIAAFWCLIGWIVVAIVIDPPKLITDEGAEVRDYLYGIRDYIALAEADRIRFLQAPGTAERIDVTDQTAVIKLYEKLLPYAMIFGIEKEWINELGRYYSVTEQPEWYSGTSNIAGVSVLASSFSSTSFATTPPPSTSGSSWSSSGGSSSFGGSSGGGSSGGGSGGGGGGGW